MLQQILIHTPLYVWAILAFLVYRGISASADREMPFGRLFIIPAVMLALSLQDLSAKFGLGALTMAAWGAASVSAAMLAWVLASAGTAPGSKAGSVMVHGSWVPLAMMMAVFVTKYAASVLLAVQAEARHDTLVIVLVSALFGIFNGVFLGRLARNASGYFRAAGQNPAVT